MTLSNFGSRKCSQQLLKRLAKVESPDVTFQSESFPVVMKKARGMQVVDVDGNRFLDFTACFGVLAFGHRSSVTLGAMRRQMSQLVHGMGDVHPSLPKVQVLEELVRMSPWPDAAKGVLGLNGSDAVESALKTALLVTGKTRVLSFAGGYHGLGFGALSVTPRPFFRRGFESWLVPQCDVLPFPITAQDEQDYLQQRDALKALSVPQFPWVEQESLVLGRLEAALASGDVAAVILEPLQGRGGERAMTPAFLQEASSLLKKYGALLIYDEIYSGLMRTGQMFAFQESGVVPDILCLGKTLGGGLPLSVALSPLMDAWGKSTGEARHTSTFLGHPLACAVGAATLKQVQKISQHVPEVFAQFSMILNNFAKKMGGVVPMRVRGRGLMMGLWFYQSPPGFVPQLCNHLLRCGFIVLPSGELGDVLALSPPFIATAAQLKLLLRSLEVLLMDSVL